MVVFLLILWFGGIGIFVARCFLLDLLLSILAGASMGVSCRGHTHI